jgi:hypothetical protein
MRTKYGICRLCEEERELCLSHALPKSAFRLAFGEDSGKVIKITDDETTPVKFSSDSWDVYLLCSVCESRLNSAYDSYGIGVLKGRVGGVRQGQQGVTFSSIDRQRLRMFCLSVLWRVSVSHHDCYRNIDLPLVWESELHRALRQDVNVKSSLFTVAIFRLIDTTPKGFEYESLCSVITAPFARSFKNGLTSVCFVFFGFLVEIFLSKLPQKIINRPGILSGRSPVFLAPFLEILEVPELLNLLVRGLQKHESGLSRVG